MNKVHWLASQLATATLCLLACTRVYLCHQGKGILQRCDRGNTAANCHALLIHIWQDVPAKV